MQLQVHTAQLVAKQLGYKDWASIDGPWIEEHPEESIRFATCHFKALLRTFRGSYYWATRGYNGGWERVMAAKKGARKWHNLSLKYYENVERSFQQIKAYKGR
jgi:soluble lytic murein transglycosylase-like protein